MNHSTMDVPRVAFQLTCDEEIVKKISAEVTAFLVSSYNDRLLWFLGRLDVVRRLNFLNTYWSRKLNLVVEHSVA